MRGCGWTAADAHILKSIEIESITFSQRHNKQQQQKEILFFFSVFFFSFAVGDDDYVLRYNKALDLSCFTCFDFRERERDAADRLVTY